MNCGYAKKKYVASSQAMRFSESKMQNFRLILVHSVISLIFFKSSQIKAATTIQAGFKGHSQRQTLEVYTLQ